MLAVMLLIQIALYSAIFITSYRYDVTSNKQVFSLKLKNFLRKSPLWGIFFLYCKISNNFRRWSLEWLSRSFL